MTSSSAPPPSRTTRLRRLLSLVLLIGGMGLAVTLLAPAFPRDNLLIFDGKGSPIRELELSWTSAEDGPLGAETLGVVRLHPGRAERRLRYVLSAPSGEYDLSIRAVFAAEDATPSTETSVLRRVTLGGNETVVPLRPAVPTLVETNAGSSPATPTE
jgi:hypothetical protein